MVRYFGVRNGHGSFDQVFAVSDNGHAVRWTPDRSNWYPLTPSRKMGAKALRDQSIEQLDQSDIDQFFRFADPPRNFNVEWRAREKWGGWVTVGLMMLPGLPLWFVWEEFVGWSGGYGETIFGIVTLLQFGSILLFREPLTEAVVRFYVKWHRWRTKQSTSHSMETMSDERFKEMVPLGQELALLDAQRNLHVRTQLHLNRKTSNTEKPVATQKSITTGRATRKNQSVESKGCKGR